MKKIIVLLLFLTVCSFESNAQEENYLVQLEVSDFKAQTEYCGTKSLFGLTNLLGFDIAKRAYQKYYVDFSFQKWAVDLGSRDFRMNSSSSLSCFKAMDTSKRNYIQDQYDAHFWGLGITKRGNLSRRFEYGAGVKANYMSISNYVVDSSWSRVRADGLTSAFWYQGHEERVGALGIEFHGQVDYRLLRKTPVYIGAHGSYSMYAVLPRRISAAGIHLLFKFGGEEEKMTSDKM